MLKNYGSGISGSMSGGMPMPFENRSGFVSNLVPHIDLSDDEHNFDSGNIRDGRNNPNGSISALNVLGDMNTQDLIQAVAEVLANKANGNKTNVKLTKSNTTYPDNFDPSIISKIKLNPVIAPSLLSSQLDSNPPTNIHNQNNPFHHQANLKVQYLGSASSTDYSSALINMTDITKATEDITKLEPIQIKDILRFLKIKKKKVLDSVKSIGNQAQKYTEQSKLILDNIRSEVIEAARDFDSIYKPLQGTMKESTMSQLRDEYMKSLTGFSVDKSKHKLVETVDPEDLNKFNMALKNTLGGNKEFYLYGDRGFLASQ